MLGWKRVRVAATLVVVGAAVTFPVSSAGATQPGKVASVTRPPGSSARIGSLRVTWGDPASTTNDLFGGAVAKSGVGVGATVVVGAPGANSNAGSTYVYVQGHSGWPSTPTATLADPAATGASSDDSFGSSVAVSGDTLVVGAYGTNSFAGAAYVYVKGRAGWPTTPTATLADPAATSIDDFGLSVAVSGDRIVVGAYGTNSSAGAVYVYAKGRSGWPTTPAATLADPAATSDDLFGASVAVSASTVVVGAYGANANAGAAYVYVKGRSGWPTTPTATLADPADTSDDLFGASVALSASTVVVGAYGANANAGAAYVYVTGRSGWPTTPTATLADPADTSNDLFGAPVAISGGTIVVGASGANANAGVAYVYAEHHSGWTGTPNATLVDPAATSGDAFGSSVAVVSGGAIVVGAFLTANAAGAAYLYSG